MTKLINGDKFRLTKSGEINKTDIKKIPSSYIEARNRAQSAWEFLAMCDGTDSPRAIEQQSMVDFLTAIYRQSITEISL